MPLDQLGAWVDEVLPGPRPHPGRLRFEPLPVEASTRRFYRVHAGAATYVAMHAPPATEDNPRFVALARAFRAGGLHTPRVYAYDEQRGYLLVEDLGRRNFETAYAEGEADAALDAALHALVLLQALPAGDIPPYTETRFAAELDLFADWLIGRLLGDAPPPFFARTCKVLVNATQSVPQRPLHRDYHCRNLLWRDDGTVGVLDFQDALIGPVTYDIASLLRDCYHAFDEADVANWRTRYLRLAGLGIDERRFARAFDLTALQRQLKAVGIFARLWLRDQRRSHLRDIVPVLRRIATLARGYPETADLAGWIDAEVVPKTAQRLAALP